MAERDKGVGQCVYVMRHGERLDSIDRQWRNTAQRPYDTPLSQHGHHEAMRLVKQRLQDKEIEVVYSSPFLRCLQTADVACKALGIPGFHTHNNLCEFLHPGNRIHAAPAVPATDDITNINILTFDLSPLPDYPETVQSVNVRYQEAVSVIADANWPANVLIVSHEICVREACKWGGCNDEVEATYCGHVELKRTERGSRDWTLLGYKGVFKYDSIIE